MFECLPIVANAANILALLPSNGRSHFKPVQPFLLDLARRGHNLTVISTFPPTSKQPNYHHVNLDHIPHLIVGEISQVFFFLAFHVTSNIISIV